MTDEPIITSLLDLDFYKLTMGQMIFHRNPSVPVCMSFINRTKSVQLGQLIDLGRLREELEHCRTLRFSSQELLFVSGICEKEQLLFRPDYIKFLAQLQLPMFQLGVDDGQLDLTFSGDWSVVTYWETLAMSIVNELYCRTLTAGYSRSEYGQVEEEGRFRLMGKVSLLKRNSEITFSDFGTRRRYSRRWHEHVISVLVEECPGRFSGTSNVLLAQKYALKPIGTNAHELPMVYSGIHREADNEDPTYSQREVLADWEAEYGLALSVFLPDTFGSDWFFDRVVDYERLRRWKGSRHDSGPALDYARKRILGYQEAGIDSKNKLVVFADGLDVQTMIRLSDSLNGQIGYTFGWGTNLTNDLGLNPVSIVVKVVNANGNPVCKLSDNVDKATGSQDEINRRMRLVDYENTFREDCKY